MGFDTKKIISEAEHDNPFAMFELARLYDIGVLPDASESKYIYWFKMFWETPKVQATLDNLDDESEINNEVNIPEEMILREYIIEAGLALCFYYMNSTNVQEVRNALSYVTGAWDAAGKPYFSADDLDGELDIFALMQKLSNRLIDMGVDYNAE